MKINLREVVAALNALDQGGKFADVDAIEIRLAQEIDNSDLGSRFWNQENPKRIPQNHGDAAIMGGKPDVFQSQQEAMGHVNRAEAKDVWDVSGGREVRIIIKHPKDGSFRVFRPGQLDKALLNQLRERGLVIYDGTNDGLNPIPSTIR